MNPRYQKKENESAYEYGLRLLEIKIEERPDDLDWQDIVDATGIDMHRDTLRKAASVSPYCGYEVAQYYKRKYAGCVANDGTYIDEIDAKIATLKKESYKLYDQRREFNKLLSKMAREENLMSKLSDAANKLYFDYPILPKFDYQMNAGDNEAVIVFSDWHYGMVTENIWSVYDTDICRIRVARLVDAVTERLKLHKCSKAHIVLLGDMAHGAIHVSARVASEENVCDQIMNVSEILAQAIGKIADCAESVRVYSTYGNHLRTVQNKNDSIHADNMEKLIPWWLERRLSQYINIKFENAQFYEFLCFDVCGKNVCATHGDLDNVKSSGQTLNTLFSKKLGFGIDYLILGDKHHEESFSELGVKSMIVGSLCGTDDYANGKRLYSNPSQTMMIFNNNVGLDAKYEIQL